ncbi:MAG: hypothetical protein SVV03_06110, partial [Candidatus Nanohaloarchaea archaeon]|nr:hypothetical protein [Candidatus Nanohaloarchaea archaeon]
NLEIPREVTRNLTSLLNLTNNPERFKRFEEYFEEVDAHSLADVAIIAGKSAKLSVSGKPLEDYTAVYLDLEPRTTIFAKILLEYIQNRQLKCNFDPSSLFITSKKPYLFKVLEEKDVNIPSTVVVSTGRGVNNVEEEVGFPAVGNKFDGFRRIDIDRIYDRDDLKSFSEHAEHGKHMMMFQSLLEGDVYDVLFIDGEFISLKLEGDSWRLTPSKGATAKYHKLGSDLKEVVRDTAESIGADLCRVRIVGDNVVGVKNNLKLQEFRDVSGKSIFGRVSEFLKGDRD